MRYGKLYLLLIIVISALPFYLIGQTTTTPKASTAVKSTWVPKPSADKLALDSLQIVIQNLHNRLHIADSSYNAERYTSAELRDEIIKLDDYRLKLESYNENFKGENLKLNQSNRILILFNSVVAILLVITLIFFLKKVGRKKVAEAKKPISPSVSPASLSSEKFASFEDKLLQLERLGKLREKNFLSEEEFIAEKQRILGR